MENKLEELKKRLGEVEDLKSIAYVLMWDQATYMPPGGAEARGKQIALLQRMAQEKASDPVLGKLIDELMPVAEQMDYDSDEAALVRVARRDFDRAVRVPPSFMERFYAHTGETFNTWASARPANDFARVRPYLEKTLDLSRERSSFFPEAAHLADPLIDINDNSMTAASIKMLFSELRQELVPLVKAIAEQPAIDDSCLRVGYPKQEQLDFSEQVVERLGYDFQRGRQDLTHHPFSIKFSVGDVRITTRVREDYLGETLFSTIHESGHAMYEQGIRPDLDSGPLGHGTSSGVHESQSRTWENLVGRSYDFWLYFYPLLQQQFPSQLGNVSGDTFYRAINKVEPSLIRTDADEVTYNLHVMIRFDLELAMLEGKLAVKDLPDAWNARYESDLGIKPADDRDGCLQDAHWYDGPIGGAFQGYTLGNILGALFYNQALAAHPEIPGDMRRGEFGKLLNWLRSNLYQHGRKFTMPELAERISGGPLRIGPYIAYLTRKYGELYRL